MYINFHVRSDAAIECLPLNGVNGYYRVDDTRLRIAIGKLWEISLIGENGTTEPHRKLAAAIFDVSTANKSFVVVCKTVIAEYQKTIWTLLCQQGVYFGLKVRSYVSRCLIVKLPIIHWYANVCYVCLGSYYNPSTYMACASFDIKAFVYGPVIPVPVQRLLARSIVMLPLFNRPSVVWVVHFNSLNCAAVSDFLKRWFLCKLSSPSFSLLCQCVGPPCICPFFSFRTSYRNNSNVKTVCSRPSLHA